MVAERVIVAELAVQGEVNAAAASRVMPALDLLNAEEEARIRELVALGTWPDGRDGTEPMADVPLDRVFADGIVQPLFRAGAITRPCRDWSEAEGVCPNPRCRVHGDRRSNTIRTTLVYGLPLWRRSSWS